MSCPPALSGHGGVYTGYSAELKQSLGCFTLPHVRTVFYGSLSCWPAAGEEWGPVVEMLEHILYSRLGCATQEELERHNRS